MNYENVKIATLKVFKECSVYSFPIDCFEILRYYDLNAHPYSSLNDELRDYCLSYSDDALNYKDKVCYNDNMPSGRIRFSLIHELGHVLLGHGFNRTYETEQEANFFASHLLAPRMAIHYANCKNHADVAKLFNMTYEASEYAFNDYKRWHRWTIHHKMNTYDKSMYSYFYNDDAECFVYSIKRCPYCDTQIYNSNEIICRKCNSPNHAYLKYEQPDDDLIIAESQWLYGGL